jgi:uncharacterized protein with HEPN domain
MTDKAPKYLSDILHAIELIENFTQSVKNFEGFASDLKTQSAVERQIGIIGEAVNKYDACTPDQPLMHTRKIVGFRNRLIHAYDAVDSSMVWAIVVKHLPSLKEEVSVLLKNY